MLVDLNTLRQNLKYLRSRAGVKLLFMVKADAYGHGMVEVAKASENEVDFFGVATVEEGIKLREAGIEKPLLVTIFSDSEAELAILNNLSVAVYSAKQLLSLENACAKLNEQNIVPLEKTFEKLNEKNCAEKLYSCKANSTSQDFADNSNCFNKLKAKVHLKLDSGMNRLGVKTNCELAKLLECVSNCHNIEVEGCYSHLYNVNNEQYNKFYEMFETVKKIYPDAISHISSSSAVCENGTDKYDMVRLGIAAYGYGDEHLKPVMSVSTKVVASKSVSVGEHIGYGDFVSTHNCSIAIIFGGYADGILRNGTGYVVLRNQKCKILSVVCMDMTIIETVGFEAEVGECAEFICESQNAEEFARDRGTIAYEALTGFSRERCEKIYLN